MIDEHGQVAAALGAIVAQSEAMLACAEAGDWAELTRQEERRSRALRRISLDSAARQSNAELGALLHRLLAINDRIIARVGEAHSSHAEVLRQFQHGRHACRAYRQVGR